MPAQSTNSLSFDGSGDWVTFGAAFPDLDGVMSLSLWFKANAISGNQALVWDNDTSGQHAIRVNASGALDWFQGGGGCSFSVGFTISAATWYHLLIVRTGSSGNWSIACYVNGTAAGDSPQTVTNNPAASPTDVRFASSAGIGGFELSGFLDHIAVWTSDKSANAAGLAAGSTTVESLSPLGYWKFDEGSGSTANDDGGGNNDGTIVNATYSSDVPVPLQSGGAGGGTEVGFECGEVVYY